MSVPADELGGRRPDRPGRDDAARATTAAADASSAAAVAADWARSRERSSAWVLRLMTWVAVACGRRVARWVLHPITLYFLTFAPVQRRNATSYLRRVLGREPRLLDFYRHVHAFASTVLDRVYLLRERMDLFDISIRGVEKVHETLADGRGAFLIGAHIGSFEALHASGRDDPCLRIAMVMYPDNARLINAALAAIAPDTELKVIALGRPDTTLAIRDWLDGGGVAGILGDRTLAGDTPRKDMKRMPFLGAPADFSDGPFRLAMMLRRRVIFMVALYHGGNRYEVRFEPLADFTVKAATPQARELAVQQALEAYVAQLEALCHELPDNWFNFHDFWNEHGR